MRDVLIPADVATAALLLLLLLLRTKAFVPFFR